MKDKCVLVTGATRGIGWAISQRLADQGCHVVGLARHVNDIDFPGYLYACDLSNAGETEEILRVIREKYPIDGVVNNVGGVRAEPLGQVELESLYSVYDLIVRVAVQVTQAFVGSMKVRREGRIINICGTAAHGAVNQTSFAAAKNALIACTKTWALELAEYGITVNAVSPGVVETHTFREHNPIGSEAEVRALSAVPLRRLGHPSDVAAAVQFLLSDDAGFITGQILGVDGGSSLAGR
ncbi:MAG: SDR family oxidoreductase [Pusillimonas sp.]|nr:SDR family oxidoreductase [Pusillimonas sp.]